MALLTEEQSILRDQARAWTDRRAPVSAYREVRDSQPEQGFAAQTWREIVELGWTGLLVPERFGGVALGFMSFGLVLEQLGRELVASPLLTSSLAGVSALLEANDETHLVTLMPGIVDGTTILTLAVDEGPRHAPDSIRMRAEARDGGFLLSGKKTFVLEGSSATHLLVAARTSADKTDSNTHRLEGLTLFVVATAEAGVSTTKMHLADGRGYSEVNFHGVELDSSAVLGRLGSGGTLLSKVLDRAAVGIAAEMLGSASRAFEMTLDYLKTRKQFGQVIGGFQALGHRAAELYAAMELARSCVEAALIASDENAADSNQLCSLAKARVGDFLFAMSNELVQMHGGIGMTDEFDAGLYLKRARAQEAAYGNRAFHRHRYARLLGF